VILSTSLPERNIFAILGLCPAIILVRVFMIGRIHSQILRGEQAQTAVLVHGSGLVSHCGDCKNTPTCACKPQPPEFDL